MSNSVYIIFPANVEKNKITKFLNERFNRILSHFFEQSISVEYTNVINADNTIYIYVMPCLTDKKRDALKAKISELISQEFGLTSLINMNYSNIDSSFNLNKLKNNEQESDKIEDFDIKKRALNYKTSKPRFSFDQVILNEETKRQIKEGIDIIKYESKIFDEWGLRSIVPTASSAMSFFGEPGTGKSMAAEAIAHDLGKDILYATYADIESKYHGEGPKMVQAIFMAAERDNAVLFIDEADSLLSKRLTNVGESNAQAINSMRSQLLISLERFKGIVIFATNLVSNYDKAFLSRLISIEFKMPDVETREKIWEQHLKGENIHIPLAEDVDLNHLANKFEFSGREIRNAVKKACIKACVNGEDKVSQSELINACEQIISEKESLAESNNND